MLKLMVLGVIAGAFFSSTFILNELMAAQGGHWFWSASLRYAFMWLILSVLITAKDGWAVLASLWRLACRHWLFWSIAGGVGFGAFYALLCFGADFAPGWVIAATFQFTTVASLIILAVLGARLSKQVIATGVLIFAGVLLTNIGEGLHGSSELPLSTLLLYGALPSLLAGFCFPIGNQLVWQATQPPSRHPLLARIPPMDKDLLKSPLNKVWLLCLGSLPFWLIVAAFVQPPMVGAAQAVNTLLVAIFAGVIATSVFLAARSLATTGGQLAAVDATQATEVVFSLIGGMILLGTPMPPAMSWIGVAMVSVGVVLFSRMQSA